MRLDLPLRKVEAVTGISNVTINLIEQGKIKNPSVFNILKLAKVYNIDPISLWKNLGMDNTDNSDITISGLNLQEAQIVNSILVVLRKETKNVSSD
jgi:transcriptional regulator with XRE-family HTH domain